VAEANGLVLGFAYAGPFRTRAAYRFTLETFKSRMEDGPGTNPEELIGAAHAGCFSMALAAQLSGAGLKPERISTRATVSFTKAASGWTIDRIDLATEASVPGISAEDFQAKAQEAKKNCPVSRALAGVEIGLDAKLV
jgi:osmotically inducible protein OsmC